jgi:hypothetical protein
MTMDARIPGPGDVAEYFTSGISAHDSFILRDALAPRLTQQPSPTLNRSRGAVERSAVVLRCRRSSPSTTGLSAPSLPSTSSCVFFESTSLMGSAAQHPLQP